MNPERWRRIEELYNAAQEREPEERGAFLADACRGDDELKREIERLLAHDSAGKILDTPAAQLLNTPAKAKPLTAGDKLGPYEIVARIGAGGMGEVYKARDTRLGREVAIKTTHAEFIGRFQHEARAISALNHPNICTLYDVGPNYLVMELVEGPDLAGPVPIATAVGYARQIAAGLEAAHEKGIIHRDLKPANIKVTPEGTVKILDFGLAKATAVPATSDAVTSPAFTMTERGMILGTAAYMSPEQARGEQVDKRADIWAFGVVLYELLTGKMLFGGSGNISDRLAAVLTSEPDFSVLPKDTPPRVCRLLELCLRKDPKQRLRDIGDVRIRLDEPEAEGPKPAAPSHRWLWAAGLSTLAVLAVLAWYRWPAERPAGPFQRIQINKLTDSGKATVAAISPDGKYVLHVIRDEGKGSLWLLHAASGSNVQILPPSQGGLSNLKFSQDGNSLYFMASSGKSLPALYTMPVLGGNARKLGEFRGLVGIAAFSPDEKHLAFIRNADRVSGLFIANLDGSGEQQLAARKSPDAITGLTWSPNGKTIAFGAVSRRGGNFSNLAAIPVEGGPETRIASQIPNFITALNWLPDGHGLIATSNTQYPFFQVAYISFPEGQVRKITPELNNYAGLSLTADAGAMVTVQYERTSHLWEVATGDSGSARQISTGRLDGLGGTAWAGNGNIYFEAPDSRGDTQIWITDANGTGRRQITTEQLTGEPAPCGDGRHLVFLSFRAGTPHIFRSDLDGGNIRQLTNGETEYYPSCSPDGSFLTYSSQEARNLGVWRLPIDGGTPVRIWDHRSLMTSISPDGKSVLIKDDEALRIIPSGGGQPIRSFDRSSGPGSSLVVQWSADGASLLYVQTSGGVSNVWRFPLEGSDPKPVTAFTSQRITSIAVAPDGKGLVLARGTISSDVVLIRDLK